VLLGWHRALGTANSFLPSCPAGWVHGPAVRFQSWGLPACFSNRHDEPAAHLHHDRSGGSSRGSISAGRTFGFFALEAAELTDARVDLTNFWGQLAQEVWHRLDEANPEDRVWILQEVLGARANGRFHTDPFIRHCVARIEAARGGLQNPRTCRRAPASASASLSGKFARHLGISPKTFARVVRFKGVMAAADRPDPPDWVRLAGDFGFADQPHLVREFKAFSGLTPADYRNAANAQPEDVGFLQDTHAAFKLTCRPPLSGWQKLRSPQT